MKTLPTFAAAVGMATTVFAYDEGMLSGALVMPRDSCRVRYEWRPERKFPVMIVPVSIGCTKADVDLHEQNWARAVRKKLGDPGRH